MRGRDEGGRTATSPTSYIAGRHESDGTPGQTRARLRLQLPRQIDKLRGAGKIEEASKKSQPRGDENEETDEEEKKRTEDGRKVLASAGIVRARACE